MGSIAVFLILEPFQRKKWSPPASRTKEQKDEASENFKGRVVKEMVDRTRWHKVSTQIVLTEKELLNCTRPYEMANLVNQKCLEWFEELKDDGLTVGATQYFWDSILDENRNRVVKVVANVIDVEHARES